MVTRTTGGPTSPAKAAIPPAMPRNRDPNTTLRLTMLGPGRKWHSAKVSLTSPAVIHLCWSTMPRRAQTSTPPKPASDILANATNSAIRLGGADVGISAAATAAGGESGGMLKDLERRPRKANPYFAYSKPTCFTPCFHALRIPGFQWFHARTGFQALFFSTFAPYIRGAGSPAMEINCRRNKPFGPGGSTRRLHPSPPPETRVSAGAKQDRRGRKGRVFSRYGSAVIGLCNSCKRQLCSGCSGRVSGLKNQV